MDHFSEVPDDVGFGIIQGILQHNFPHCSLNSNFNGVKELDSAVALSHVNRRWRRLILSVPQAWTCIHLDIIRWNSVSCLEMVHAYLERSSSLPISIIICCLCEIPHYESHLPAREIRALWPQWWATWDALMSNRHRWQNCVIYGRYRRFIEDLLGTMNGLDFWELRDFGLFLRTPAACASTEGLQIKIPNLRSLRLSNIEIWPALRTLNQQTYRGLTEVVLHDLHESTEGAMRNFVAFLRCVASTVVTLVVSNIDLPATEDIEHLRRDFHFPALTTLFISSSQDFAEWILDETYPVPTVQDLVILESSGSEVSDLLTVFPNVRNLRLSDYPNVVAEFLIAMESPESFGRSGIMLPMLKTLYVYVCHASDPALQAEGHFEVDVALANIFVNRRAFGVAVDSVGKMLPRAEGTTRMNEYRAPRLVVWSRGRPSSVPWNIGDWDTHVYMETIRSAVVA